jgi:hypothetical protein
VLANFNLLGIDLMTLELFVSFFSRFFVSELNVGEAFALAILISLKFARYDMSTFAKDIKQFLLRNVLVNVFYE